MKKFMIFASLVAFIAVVSCNTNPPTPPLSYEQQMTELFDYWPYTVGDSFAYVNEVGDSIVLEVYRDSISNFISPTYDPEKDSDESGPCVAYDCFEHHFFCKSKRNFLNRDDLKFSSSFVFLNKMYGKIIWNCQAMTKLPVIHLSGECYTIKDYITKWDSIVGFFADSVKLLRIDKEKSNEANELVLEECGDLIRGKGIVRWTDLDGHEWELVDLMNK